MYSYNIHMAAINIQFTKIETQIASYLFKHYKDRFNPRQLARLLKINHANANRLCKILTEKQLIRREEIGNSLYYTYNYDNPLAVKFMEYMLSLEKLQFPTWLSVVQHSLERFSGKIKIGLVFGSSIRDRHFNDIDVLLVYDKTDVKAINKLKAEIRASQQITKPIRYVEMGEEDLLLNKDDRIFYSLMSENLIFHSPEKYAEAIIKCRK